MFSPPRFLGVKARKSADFLGFCAALPRRGGRFIRLPGAGPRTSLAAMMDSPQQVSFLDRPAARLCAVGVAVLMAAALAFMHRDDLFPPEQAAVDANDPVALCLTERAADIDRMLAEGTITAEQAALFKSRAEALCQAQLGGGSGPPPPPQ